MHYQDLRELMPQINYLEKRKENGVIQLLWMRILLVKLMKCGVN